MRTNPSLLRLIVGYFLITLIVIVMPGLWVIQASFEERLIEEKIKGMQDLVVAWTTRFSQCSYEAEQSISRFSREISRPPSPSFADPAIFFDKLVKKDDDGSWRSDRALFNPEIEAGIWLPPKSSFTDAGKGQYLRYKKTTELFGEGASIHFVNTWVLPREGGVIIYWPSEPDFVFKTAPELDYSATEWISLTKPSLNPGGLPRWTRASYEPTSSLWMISVVAPYTRNGKWAGAVGHDLPLVSFKERMNEINIYPGTCQLIVRKDGLVLFSNEHEEQINSSKGNFHIEELEDLELVRFLREIIADVNRQKPPTSVLTTSGKDNILFVSHIESQDWFFVSVVPRNVLIQTVRASYHVILIFVGIALFLIGLIPALFIFRVILPRINRLVGGIREVSTGNLDYRFIGEGSREFEFIADTLNNMTAGIKLSMEEIKSAEEDLAFKNLILSTQQETSLDGILVVDKNGRICSFNRRVVEIWGIPQEVIDSGDDELILQAGFEKAQNPDQFLERVRYLLAHPEEKSRDEIVLKDGRILDRYSSPMTGPDGNYFGRVWYFRDITAQILAAQEKEQIENQLRQAQKMEAIGTLAGGIAHDFNNILSAIYGYTELAYDEINNPALLRKHLDEITNGAERATKLVRQILTFSRKSEQEKKPLRVSLVVKEALKFLRSSIPATIEIRQDINSETLVLADPTQIHQIIMNLCTNAYHAMRESGGILEVTLKDIIIEEDGAKSVPELVPGRYLQLEIRDTGTGMDEETQIKIFEPYFTTKRVGEGTGLGLAVVHGVVKSHGGVIRVNSAVGKGTVFQVYFPVYEGENERERPREEKVALLNGNEVIMLVDDDSVIVDIVTKSIKKYGYKVISFSNGLQAYQELERHPDKYDLLITDMTMPLMTGAELSRKALELCPTLPIILCSGHSDLIKREKALAMGIMDYCEKPLNIKKMLLTVRKVLDREREKGNALR